MSSPLVSQPLCIEIVFVTVPEMLELSSSIPMFPLR